MTTREVALRLPADTVELAGVLAVPPAAADVVLFAHESGSSATARATGAWRRRCARRKSARCASISSRWTRAEDRAYVFDIPFRREARDAVQQERISQGLAVGYFGASTGAAAALVAAAGETTPSRQSCREAGVRTWRTTRCCG